MEFRDEEAAPCSGLCPKAALTHSRLQKPLLQSRPKKCPNLLFPQERFRKACGTDFNQQESPESGVLSALGPSAGAGSPGKPRGRDDAIPRHARTGRPSFAVY